MGQTAASSDAMQANAMPREADAIAPRISLAVFCVTPGFATCMQTASGDRRMAKTKVWIGMGGCDAAVKRYQDRATPNLVIVETQEQGFSVFSDLERLAEVCSEETRVIVAGPSNDVSLYRELIRQGVCEYLVTPSSPLQVIEAITTAFATPGSAPVARSIVVFGVRGGVGSSVICHNLAAFLAQNSEKDTVLVDMDFEFGTAALDFNIEVKHTVVDAFSDLDSLDDVKIQRLIYPFNDYLKLLPAPADLRDKLMLSDDSALTLLDAMRHSCDLLVIDAPHSWSPSVACSLRQAETIMLVASPDLACLRNLKTVFDWLVEERPHDARPRIILNQIGMPKRPEISAREFQEIVGAPIDAFIPYEPAIFGAAQNDGKLLGQITGGQKIAAKIEALADSILGLETNRGYTGAKKAKVNPIGVLSDALAGVLGKK